MPNTMQQFGHEKIDLVGELETRGTRYPVDDVNISLVSRLLRWAWWAA